MCNYLPRVGGCNFAISLYIRLCTVTHLINLHIKSIASSRTLLGFLHFQYYFHLIIMSCLEHKLFKRKRWVWIGGIVGIFICLFLLKTVWVYTAYFHINVRGGMPAILMVNTRDHFSNKICFDLLWAKWGKNLLAA